MSDRLGRYVQQASRSLPREYGKAANAIGKYLKKKDIENKKYKQASKRAAKKQKTSKSQKGNTKVSNMPSGQLAGKVYGPRKPVHRTKKYGGLLTKYGMAQKGISTREEWRKVDPNKMPGVTPMTPVESRVIGHTSLPVRATYYNVWRAVLKTLFVRAGSSVDSLTNGAGISGNILVKYHSNWMALNQQTQNYTITGSIWQEVFDNFSDWIMNLFDEDPRVMRFREIEYIPTGGSSVNRTRMALNQIKIVVHSKSCLKFQNQSGIYYSTADPPVELTEDLQSDDITNIPIECNMYYVTGNQFVHQNKRTSQTVGLGFLGFDDYYKANDVGSEPCPAYEYINCTGKTKITLDPGHVKTSIISHNKSYNFGELIRGLVRKQDQTTGTKWTWNDNAMLKSLGHSRIIHCDRVIGALRGTVRLLFEIELTQQVACLGGYYTVTDQYEKQLNG